MWRVVLLALLFAAPAWAQQPRDIPQVTLSSEDRTISLISLAKFYDFLMLPRRVNPLDPNSEKKPLDPDAASRVVDIINELEAQRSEVNPGSVPFLSQALSRNSKDAQACALLRRITPPPAPACEL